MMTASKLGGFLFGYVLINTLAVKSSWAQGGDPASLDRLNDIVVPPAVSWWPPAPGWYFLAVVLLIAFLLACASMIRRYRANRYRREALAELVRLKPGPESLKDLADLLKRTAMTASGRDTVAALSGDQWVEWLNGQCAHPVFQDVSRELLARSLYTSNSTGSEQDVAALYQAVRQWVSVHRSMETC